MKLNRLIVFVFLNIFSFSYNSFSQCNTNISICDNNSLAGPFSFSAASPNPSSCLDYWNGQGAPNYAYITLYITQSGNLNLLIDGNSTTGCIDVSIFDITGQANPCGSLGPATEIGCNYASNCDGCNEFGSTFASCLSEVPAPYVNAGDVIMILIEDWSNAQSSFTLQLDNSPGSAQTGPPDATINPAGPFPVTDPPYTMTAANGGGTWSASCGACINPTTGAFDPGVAGAGTHQICYDIGAAPCDANDCINVTVGPVCTMTGITANSSITCPSATYTTTGQVSFTNPPTTGTLTVTDCNGNNQVFNAPFTSPINYTINNQTADGLGCDITATFSANTTCNTNITYTAPQCPCNIDVFTTNINICDAPTNTYSLNGTVEFSMPPLSGTLVISVDNGTGTTYDTIINAANFTSPLSYSISGIPANGANSVISATFSADNTCTNSINFTAPADCSCNANIGTFTQTINGVSQNNYVLCYGDQFVFQANGDYTPPPDVNDPLIPYNPGIGYLIYSCPPTPGMTPDNDPVTGDPCILGLVTDGDANALFSDINDLGWINAFPAGTFTDNIIYWVPVTMYDTINNYYSATNTGTLCYDIGQAIPVQYLPEIKSVEAEDCQAGSITTTITGGLSEIDGSNYTVVPGSLVPANANFVNTTAVHGGTITINGLTNGQNYAFDIIDANGCPITISGTFIGTQNPGFSYNTYVLCSNDPDPIITITGDPGTFSYTTVSGGPTLSLNTNTGAIDVSASNPGVYDVTYTTNDPICFEDSTVTITINETPTVVAVSDITICAGNQVNQINFTGTPLGVDFNWTNSNTSIGLNATGSTLIPAFNATNSGTTPITATITVTPFTTTCTGTPTTFDITVNPQDDPSFNYVNGLTYCNNSGINPVANITGVTGGTFSYTVNSGGPNLGLNTTTGDIDLLTSNTGNYHITYTTNGACPNSSSLDLAITTIPEANFSIQDACDDGASFPLPTPNPMPNYVADDNGVPFANTGSGGVFSELNNDPGLSINSTTGEVDLLTSLPGTYTIVNSITLAGCAPSSYQDDLTIFALPNATLSGSTTVCPGADLTQIDLQVDMTGSTPFDLTYSANGNPISVNNVNSPYVFNPTQFGAYTLTSVVDANNCFTNLNQTVTVDSFPTPHVHPHNDYVTCENEPLQINDFVGFETGNTFVWTSSIDLGFGLNGVAPPHIGTFTPTTTGTSQVSVYPISQNGCVGPTRYFNVTVSPMPIVDFSAVEQSGCEPFTPIFINNSTETFNCEWDFGNGVTQQGCGQTATTYNEGIYDVSLTVTSQDGCVDSLTLNNYIDVYAMPEAHFGVLPEVTDITNTEIEFINNSQNAETYTWDFGDESGLSNEVNPLHTYPEVPEQYVITLIASNANYLCTDTAYATVIIKDILIFYVPNVFTPDNDEYNQTFYPVFTSGFDPFNYHLMIFNRWGEIIFESFNTNVGWDGTYPEDGTLCEDGVYVWKIDFKESMSDKRHYYQGHVTLLK